MAQKRQKARTTIQREQHIQQSAPPAYLTWLANWPCWWTDAGTGRLKQLFLAIAGIGLIWMIWAGQGTGINGDDRMQNEYEQALISWYSTGGADTTALNLPKTKMHFYGGFFEVISGATNRLLGFDSPEMEGYHQVRHIWNALFGWTAIFFAALLVGALTGWEGAILGFLVLFLSPRFLGHGVMNPKDIPFAAGYIMSLYYILAWLKSIPKPSWNTIAGLAIGLGMALGVRSGGLILIAIFGLFAFLHFVANRSSSGSATQTAVHYLKWGILPVLGGLLITLAFWPFALQSPIQHISDSLSELSNYGVNIRLLFNGDMVFAQSLPLDYLPRWVFVTVPLFVLFGWLAGLVFLRGMFRRYGTLPMLMLGFAFLFPFVYVMYKGSTLYDGWRHMLFPYTAGAVLASLGIIHLYRQFSSIRWMKPAVLGLVGLMALDPFIFILRNPHLSYVYFSPVQGGMAGALGEYETDYWGISVKQGIDWLESEGIIREGMEEEVTIASNFGYQLDKYLTRFGDKVKPVYVRYRQRHDADWDYGLFQSRFIDGSYIRQGSWPPGPTIHTIDANSTPLLAIVKSPGKTAFEGINAQKQNRFAEAIPLLEEAIKQDPADEVLLSALAFCLINTGQNDLAKVALDNTFLIDPENLTAANYLGLYHINRNEIEPAIRAFERAAELQENNFFAYYYLASLELQRNNLNIALDYAKKAVATNPKFKGAYELAASIFDKMGDPGNANAYRNAASQLK